MEHVWDGCAVARSPLSVWTLNFSCFLFLLCFACHCHHACTWHAAWHGSSMLCFPSLLPCSMAGIVCLQTNMTHQKQAKQLMYVTFSSHSLSIFLSPPNSLESSVPTHLPTLHTHLCILHTPSTSPPPPHYCLFTHTHTLHTPPPSPTQNFPGSTLLSGMARQHAFSRHFPPNFGTCRLRLNNTQPLFTSSSQHLPLCTYSAAAHAWLLLFARTTSVL